MPTIFEQGRREGRQELLLNLLRQKFGVIPTEVEARVRHANAATLDRWALRILTAATLEEAVK